MRWHHALQWSIVVNPLGCGWCCLGCLNNGCSRPENWKQKEPLVCKNIKFWSQVICPRISSWDEKCPQTKSWKNASGFAFSHYHCCVGFGAERLQEKEILMYHLWMVAQAIIPAKCSWVINFPAWAWTAVLKQMSRNRNFLSGLQLGERAGETERGGRWNISF